MVEEIDLDDFIIDVSSKTDEELKRLLDGLCRDEKRVSYKRRIIHGRIDILRGEMIKRLKDKRSRGEKLFTREDIDRLSEILAKETRDCKDDAE